MTLTAGAAMADAQADFQHYIKNYNQALSSHSYETASHAAASAAKVCGEAKNYDGAFKLLSSFDNVMAERGVRADSLPTPYYYSARARYELYRKMGNAAQAEAWLKKMGGYARATDSRQVADDMLVTEAQFYYAQGRDQLGDQCIARLIKHYENENDYSSADTAYQRLIEKAVSANDARFVEQTFENYMKWSDSIEAITQNTELSRVKAEVASEQAEVARKQGTINSRTSVMIVFITLFIASLAAIGVCIVFYQRVKGKLHLSRLMIRKAEAQSAAKSAMLQNLSSTMNPALDQLDPENPAVQSLKGYVRKVEELSEVDSAPETAGEPKDQVNIEHLCASLADQVRPQLKRGVTLSVDGARGSAPIDADEVSKIVGHLLENAAKYTSEGGRITLSFRKRGPGSYQFVVTDNGVGIPADQRDKIFEPFAQAGDITTDGDRLGLPICALRAKKMGGTLTLDRAVTRGASFILSLKS